MKMIGELTIYTVWYDGTNAKIYWGNTIKTENRPTNWNKGQIEIEGVHSVSKIIVGDKRRTRRVTQNFQSP